jgi:hypothetical protein
MFKIIFPMIIVFIVGILFLPAGAIQVSGDIWGTWHPADNPFEVTGDLLVPGDSSLTILPGCLIQFQGHFKMTVDTLAKLIAMGTEQDSIKFFPADTAIGWAGLRLFDVDTMSRFSYCSFTYRTYVSSDSFDGAIYFDGAYRSILNIDHCSFYRNRYGRSMGAAIFTRAAFRVSIQNSSFTENNPGYGTGYDWGGLINFEGSELFVSRNIFKNNEGGGILSWNNSTISNNVFINNLGTAVGQYWGDAFIVDHNIFYGNSSGALMPSAIMAQEVFGTVRITNNTMCNNVSGSGAGDNGVCSIWNEHGNGTIAYLTNNIFWGDSLVPQIGVDGYNSVYVNYSNIRGGYAGTGNINADPLFVDSANGDYSLSWNSPCIDAGDPASPLDQDGSRADMGALPFIHAFTNYIPGDINGDDASLASDVTFGVRYLRGIGAVPPDSIYNDSTFRWLYSAADANGSCEFRGSDITYLVGYFKGINPVIRWCPQTPPY